MRNPNLLHLIQQLRAEVNSLELRTVGFNGTRPICCAENKTTYWIWYHKLTIPEQLAERELKRQGYYNHEGTNTMFGIKDKNGKQIYTDDLVEWQGNKCIVTCILSEREVQLNPLGEGLPELVTPEEITVLESYIEKLRRLPNCEELQAILKGAEVRLQSEMAQRKSEKTKSGAPTKAKPATPAVEAEEL